MKTTISDWREFVFHEHNVVCNQKYDGMPYSRHLKYTEKQGLRFLYEYDNIFSEYEKDIIKLSLPAHDLMEDARMTYNNISNVLQQMLYHNMALGSEGDTHKMADSVADIIYCVTDEKGRNRKERKNDKYYEELKQNRLAVFVKLADIAANRMYSKLSGSTMYNKYVNEFPNVEKQLFREEFKEFFEYIKNI